MSSLWQDRLKPKNNDSIIMTPNKERTLAETVRDNILNNTVSAATSNQSTQATTKANTSTQTKNTAQSKSAVTKPEKKKQTGFQTTEPAYSDSPIFKRTYDWKKDQQARMLKFGIPTVTNALNENAAGSLKIVGDDVTEQDYLDLFEGFRSVNDSAEGNTLAPTVENRAKLSGNTGQARKGTTTESRDARVCRQYAERVQAERDAKYAIPGYKGFYTEKHTELNPERKYIYTGKDRFSELYGAKSEEQLDDVSRALAAASLIPGLDTFADMAAVPVDLMRGDYVSAGLDLLGAVPFIGEAGDTAKLAKLGIEAGQAAKNADNVIDAARAIENADEVVDTGKLAVEGLRTADNVSDVSKTVKGASFIYDSSKVADTADAYHAAKIDGTIKGFLDAADDPITEMSKISGSIAKTSPIQIPEVAVIKPKVTNEGYYHMEYKWMTDDGYEYKSRWHTRNPTAPLEQRDVWVIERKLPGVGAGTNHRQRIEQVWVGGDEWITKDEWRNAARANQLGIATEQQKRWLKNGHNKA